MISSHRIVSVRLFLTVVGLGASASVASAGQTPINTMCPVMQEEQIDPDITVTYKGRTIGFCCDRCVDRFKNDPEKYVARIAEWTEATDEASEPPRDTEKIDSPGGDSPPADEDDMPFAARIHPALVHVPIAALPIALLGLVVWLWTGKVAFAKSDAIPMIVAALSSVPAYLTGEQAEHARRFSTSMHEIAERHESAALVVMVLSLALAALRIWRWNRLTGTWLWLYGVGLVTAVSVVTATGYLGGSLVFGPDHLTLPF